MAWESRETVERRFKAAKDAGAKYLLQVCDTFNYEQYFVEATSEADLQVKHAKYDGLNMQRVDATYDLLQPMNKQLDRYYAPAVVPMRQSALNERYIIAEHEAQGILLQVNAPSVCNNAARLAWQESPGSIPSGYWVIEFKGARSVAGLLKEWRSNYPNWLEMFKADLGLKG